MESSESPTMSVTAAALAEELVAMFPAYLRRKVAELGVAVDGGLAREIARQTVALDESLRKLFAAAPHRQEASPLELVRDAIRPLSEFLNGIGVSPRPRDAGAVTVHPDDPYELFPASPRDMGEEVWRRHMAWGIDKARLVAGVVPAAVAAQSKRAILPTVALFGMAPADRESIKEKVLSYGYHVAIWHNPGGLEAGLSDRPVLVIVDVRHGQAGDAIRKVAAAGVRIVATGEGVDDFAAAGLMALGAEEVVELDRIIDRLADLLPLLA